MSISLSTLVARLSGGRATAARSETSMPVLPLLGLFRSGTNITRALLETHFEVRVSYNSLGWKHGLLPTVAPGSSLAWPAMAPLVIVKHPLANLLSLQVYQSTVGRNLHSAAGSAWPAFLRERIVCRCDELPQAPQYRFSNPVQLWNTVVWNHVHYARLVGGCVVRYEDLLAQPQSTCEQIAEHFSLRHRSNAPTFGLPSTQARRMDDRRRGSAERYLSEQPFTKAGFYLNADYLAQYTDDDRAFVSSELDGELLTLLGYEPF